MSRVRITGGEWRSRLIPVIDAPGLRPTPDRVRETVFNWLGQDLSGLTCLDLFAGSGALGFEAASRGAAQVTLVESSRLVFAALKKAADAFACPRIELVNRDALEFAAISVRRFDLIFLDPPYGQGWLQKIRPHLSTLAADDGLVYAEAESMDLAAFEGWRAVKQGKAGQVYFHLLERA